MENFLLLFNGFQVALTFNNLLACLLGAALGIVMGATPGIGAMAGVALLLPLTFGFEPTTAIIMLGSVYFANMYGSAFSAILLNIPGDSTAIMTALDGYPMATRKGRPGQALFTSNLSSFIGGTVGILILTFAGPALARVGLRFGPAEMTSLLLMAMTSVGWLVGDNPLKGISVSLLGILIATMGMDTLTGVPRYHFNNMHLLGGIPFIPFVIGAVGFSQIIKMMAMRNSTTSQAVKERLTIRGSLLSKDEVKRIVPAASRASLVGSFVGILPGAGATTGSFLGYAAQKGFKTKEPLGTGAVEGIAASESANSAAAGLSFGPMLALGIPGSGTTAVLLGGLIMWGLSPGPLLFTQAPEFAWGLIASLYLSNIATLIFAVLCVPFIIKILSAPIKLIIPVIVVICFTGAFASTNSMFGVVVMLASSIVGYVLDKHKYPIAPMLLAYVLAPMLEDNMRRALIISDGSLSIFFNRPISLGFLLVFFGLVLFPLAKLVFSKIMVRIRENSQTK